MPASRFDAPLQWFVRARPVQHPAWRALEPMRLALYLTLLGQSLKPSVPVGLEKGLRRR
ncbi:hypothetical protein [Meiothermus sp.]|uniref:hypothetical protein n=1 Tax=Meiothermus sp. TaxID=1955249 RepID=UPI00298F0ED1|nr:hypothetical protein [Meiothermus sp.]